MKKSAEEFRRIPSDGANETVIHNQMCKTDYQPEGICRWKKTIFKDQKKTKEIEKVVRIYINMALSIGFRIIRASTP